MKITNVRACQPLTPDSPNDWRTSVGQILVAVDTDLGLTGYGVGGGGFAGIHVIRTVLRDALLGKKPADIAALWRDMFDATMAFGQKGLVIMALSGVDLALWDLKGRAEEVPIAELLGGAKTNRLPTYITVWDNKALEPTVEHGYQGFKLHLGEQNADQEDVTEFAERIADQLLEARQMIGPDRELTADAWMRWDLDVCRAVAARLDESVNLGWLEEPLALDDEAGYATLVNESPFPIAGGEHEYTTAGFRHLIDHKLHNVLQPDVNWCGGLSVLIDVYRMAADANIRVCPHRGSEIWSLHAIGALDPNPLAESGRPWMTWVKGQPPIEDGWIELPEKPGFGIDIDEDNLETVAQPDYSKWTR
jgi:L-alanine-DL-glutamate epimerase-like enolase superfamily enzyme